MPISSSVRHGDPIADIRQSLLPGAGQQAFATRQFQEFLDDLEFVSDQLDSSKIDQQLALIDKIRTQAAAIGNRIAELESLQITIITTATAHTTNGNETVICTNTTPVTHTLNPLPIDGEVVNFQRQNIGTVTISGAINGGTEIRLLSRYDAPNFVFTVDAGEWAII